MTRRFHATRTALSRLGLVIGAGSALLAIGATHAGAQASPPRADQRLFGALTWRNVGPFRAGRVGAVSGVSKQPGVYYAGYPGGGLWKTTSGGQVWFPVFDGVRETSSIGAVEAAPSNPDVVYVGTGDMITGGTLDQGTGVYRSTDAGATWRNVGLTGTRHIQTLSVDPRSADVVLVGALGDHINANDQRGLFRTTDGGTTWTRTLSVDNETGVAKITRTGDMPDVIFATTARHWTPPGYAVGSFRSWQFSTVPKSPADTVVPRAGLWKSLDGGITWKEIRGNGLPKLDGRMAVAVAMGTNAQRVYLITNSALWRSDDGGASWRQMAADDPRIRNGQGGYSCGVYVDPRNPDLVYTINTAAYRSTDGGKTFTGMKGAPGGDDPQQLWIDPMDGTRILMGLDQGATITLDGGRTWSSWYNQSTEQLYHLSADNSFPYWIYATQQDAGAIRTRSRGNYGAITMFDWTPVNGWEWGTIVADPADPNTVFTSGTGVVRTSYPSEQTINVSPAIDPAAKARVTSSSPLVFTPWNPKLLLAGLNYVTGTTDHGAHWTRMSPELGIAAGMDSATAANTLGGRGAIESMSPAVRAGEIWVGTNNGLIHLTRDGGTTWRDVSIAGLPSPRRAMISGIEASPHVAGTAYAAVEYLRTGDHTPHLFRTRDFGKSWTKIVTGLPVDEVSGSFARVIRADPVARGLLYAGTESGAYVSFDDGDRWESLSLNLPNTPVRDLLVKDNDLVAATHGRGVWIIDDISALRAIAATRAAPRRVVLFAPGRATRLHRNVNGDTPLPPDMPHAKNALEGAIIDYWLQDAAPGGVTIDVLDASGAVVRHLTSVPQPLVAESVKPSFPDLWIERPEALPTTAGPHRVHWDLRHDAPAALSRSYEINANAGGTPASPEGALVAPGRYTLRLTTSAGSASVTLQVRNDPRSPATAAAVLAQHALQVRIMTAMQVSYAAQQQVTALRATLSRADAGAPADLVTALATFRAALDAAVGRDDRSAFRTTNDALGAQLNAQDLADNVPNAGMLAAFTTVSRDIDAAQSRWRTLLTRELPALNTALSRAGRPAISVP